MSGKSKSCRSLFSVKYSLSSANILRDPTSVREETAKRFFKTLRTETDFND